MIKEIFLQLLLKNFKKLKNKTLNNQIFIKFLSNFYLLFLLKFNNL
jgi:hypothetical protein